jgi:hypothetical protein
MIGGDVSLTQLRVAQLATPTGGSLFLSPPSQTHSKTSLCASIALLVKVGLATDPFIMVATLKTGIIQSIIAALFILFLTYGSVEVFIRSWGIGEAYTHSEIWRWVIDRGTGWIPSLFVALGYVAAISFCFWDVMDCVPAVLEWVWPEAPAIVSNQWFLQYLVCVISALPSLTGTGFRSFVWISWLGSFCEVVGLSCALMYFFRHMFDDGGFKASGEVVLFRLDFESVYCALRDFNICFFVHPAIPLVGAEMAEPTRERIVKLTWGTLVTVGLFSYVIPLISYLLFIEGEPESCFFLYLDPVGSPEVVVGTIAVFIIAICTIMIFAFITSHSVVSIFGVGLDNPRGQMVRMCGSLAAMLLAIGLNFAGDMIFLLFQELASLCYTLLSYFLPAIYFLVQFKVKALMWGILAAFVFACGGFLAILGIIETVNGATML